MPETTASMEIRGNLTWADLQRYYYFVMLRDRWGSAIVWISAFVALTILGVVYEWHFVIRILSGLFAFQQVYAYAWSPVILAKAGMTNVKAGDPVTYSLDSEGIHMTEPNLLLSVAWKGCKDVYETQHLFIIYIPHGLSHQIPKRFFDSPEQVGMFRELLTGRIPAQNFKQAGLVGRWC